MATVDAGQLDTLLRKKLEERCTSLTDAFRKVDRSGNGFITAEDFDETLRSWGVRVTRASVTALVQKYDLNNDGLVSYAEFCARLAGGPVNPALAKEEPIVAPSAADRAEETLRRLMYSHWTTLTEAFLKVDADRSGFCDKDEFASIFRLAGIELAPDELTELVKKYDVNSDGRLDVSELAKLLSGGSTYDGHGDRGMSPRKKARR